MALLIEFTSWTWLLIIVAAFFTGVLQGATGMLGGIIMTAVLSQIIGIKQAIPVMTCALIFSHASRAHIYWQQVDSQIATRVLLFAGPTLVAGAYLFSLLNSKIIATAFVFFLIFSFPMKYYARLHNIKTGPRLLASASMIWGMLAGNVIGPGFFLAPFLLGTGMSRLTFVGTLATIMLLMNIIKLSVFGSTNLITLPLFMLGVIVGLITIPANWVGKAILQKLSDDHHFYIVDIFTVLVILNFTYLAVS